MNTKPVLISDIRPAARARRTVPRRPQNGRPQMHAYMLPKQQPEQAPRSRDDKSATLQELLERHYQSIKAQPRRATRRPAVIRFSALHGSLAVPTTRVSDSEIPTSRFFGIFAGLRQAPSTLATVLALRMPMRYTRTNGIGINWSALPRKRAAGLVLAGLFVIAALGSAGPNTPPAPVDQGQGIPAGMPAILLPSGASDGTSDQADTGQDLPGKSDTWWNTPGWNTSSPNRGWQPTGTSQPITASTSPSPMPASPSSGTGSGTTPVTPPSTTPTPVTTQPAPVQQTPASGTAVTVPPVTLPLNEAPVTLPGASVRLGL